MTTLVSSRDFHALDFSSLCPDLNQQVHLDLGTGLGHFVVEMARAYPDAFWLGIEHEGPIAKRAAKRLDKSGLKNAAILCADARLCLLEWLPPRRLAHVWINFPDPWPKDRHANRRHTHPRMLGLMLSRLQLRGELHLATDVPAYFEEFTERIVALPVTDAPRSEWRRATLGVQTKYERKWAAVGKTFQYGDWQYTGSADLDPAYAVTPGTLPTVDYTASPPQPQSVQHGQYVGKIFPPRKQAPQHCHFLLVDTQTGIESHGEIDFANQNLRMAGRWTDWKHDLFVKMTG